MKSKFTLFLFFICCMLLVCFIILSNILATNIFPLPSLPKLQKGDWVFRQGTSLDSAMIQILSQGHFSHIGIVLDTTPKVIILHATTDDDPKRPNQVIVSSVSQFFRQDLAQKIAIVRPHFLTEDQKQKIINLLRKEIGAPFVLDKQSKPHRYCTTIIENAIKYIYPDFTPQWQTIDVPFFQGNYLFPDAFLTYPKTEQIYMSNNLN